MLQSDCCFCQKSSAICSVKTDAVPAEVDEMQNHMQTVILETHHLAW